jgi:hypothetical protein
MKRSGFISSELAIDYKVVDRVQDILPAIEAAAAVAEPAPASAVIERM